LEYFAKRYFVGWISLREDFLPYWKNRFLAWAGPVFKSALPYQMLWQFLIAIIDFNATGTAAFITFPDFFFHHKSPYRTYHPPDGNISPQSSQTSNSTIRL